MQTFLPLPSFSDSARVLDRLRLGKQRVEVYQILRTLKGESSAWRNHPAVRMWRGYEVQLGRYGLAICREWVSRGYVDNLAPRILRLSLVNPPVIAVPPPWLRSKATLSLITASHRSNLLRKNPAYYGAFGWEESDDLEYVWPV